MSEQPLIGRAGPGSGAGLIEFLDAAAEKGWFNPSTAKALRTAVVKILSIDDDWEGHDLRTLDLDDQFDRFQTLKHNDYSDGSMRVYKSRFHQAVRMYLARLDKDPSWKSYGPAPRSASSNKAGKTAVARPNATTSESTMNVSTALPSVTDDDPVAGTDPEQSARPVVRQIEHRFPLRDELDVTLRLPRDLTSAEADELASYIRTLARIVTPPREVNAGSTGP